MVKILLVEWNNQNEAFAVLLTLHKQFVEMPCCGQQREQIDKSLRQ